MLWMVSILARGKVTALLLAIRKAEIITSVQWIAQMSNILRFANSFLTGNSLPPTYPTGAHIFAPSAMGPGISGGDPAGFPVDLNFDVLTTDLLDFFQTGYVQYGA